MAFMGIVAGCVAAQDLPGRPFVCTFETGEHRLVWDGAPIKRWERCIRRISVIKQGFTTIELTFGLSATYDRQTKRFSHTLAGGTDEFIKPGEHLLILDAKLNGRQLVYSLSNNSFRFVNLLDVKEKIMSPEKFEKLKADNSADQLFVSVAAPSDFYRKADLKHRGKIGGGRTLAWRSNMYDKFGSEYVKVECISPKRCEGKIGWIPKTSLAEIKHIPWPKNPFPSTFEYPTRKLIKACGVKSKVTQSAEIKSVISAKVPFAKLVGPELSVSIEAALKSVLENEYGEDVRIERTIFTVFKFRAPGWFEAKRWIPKKPRVLIVDRFTYRCNTAAAKTHFLISTDDGQFQVTESMKNAEITSSVAHARFVTQAMASLKGRVKEWALNYIASALSAQRR